MYDLEELIRSELPDIEILWNGTQVDRGAECYSNFLWEKGGYYKGRFFKRWVTTSGGYKLKSQKITFFYNYKNFPECLQLHCTLHEMTHAICHQNIAKDGQFTKWEGHGRGFYSIFNKLYLKHIGIALPHGVECNGRVGMEEIHAALCIDNGFNLCGFKKLKTVEELGLVNA